MKLVDTLEFVDMSNTYYRYRSLMTLKSSIRLKTLKGKWMLIYSRPFS
jgi:hypothetical protein